MAAAGDADTAKMPWQRWRLLAEAASMVCSWVVVAAESGSGECGGIGAVVRGSELTVGLHAQAACSMGAVEAALALADGFETDFASLTGVLPAWRSCDERNTDHTALQKCHAASSAHSQASSRHTTASVSPQPITCVFKRARKRSAISPRQPY